MVTLSLRQLSQRTQTLVVPDRSHTSPPHLRLLAGSRPRVRLLKRQQLKISHLDSVSPATDTPQNRYHHSTPNDWGPMRRVIALAGVAIAAVAMTGCTASAVGTAQDACVKNLQGLSSDLASAEYPGFQPYLDEDEPYVMGQYGIDDGEPVFWSCRVSEDGARVISTIED